MPDFTRVINQAYTRILERPVDPGGLETYNQAMNQGLTEAQMRESLIRSQEYANKNPDASAAATVFPKRRTTKKKKAATKKTRKNASRKR